ncbi:hypothetical protein HDV05_003793 [Chytridiales sp. JEL 0842]|nr:hypothetical protein HDV05_003793 [Chytridiales sp. JEL 0842]
MNGLKSNLVVNPMKQQRAAELKLDGKCPGPFDNGCKHSNNAVVGRTYCVDCQALVDEHSAKYNGSAAQLLSLTKSYARKKGRPMPSVPIYAQLKSNQESFRNALQPVQHILQAPNVVVWDTESDGVGSTNDLPRTREYYLRNLTTGKSLHIIRDTPTYSHELAARQITEFIQAVDFVIAYEPSNCDRLRLKALLGDDEFALVANKFVDFKRLVIDRVIEKTPNSNAKAYAPDKMLNTIYTHFFSLEGQESQPQNLQLVEAPAEWASEGQKCKLDVAGINEALVQYQDNEQVAVANINQEISRQRSVQQLEPDFLGKEKFIESEDDLYFVENGIIFHLKKKDIEGDCKSCMDKFCSEVCSSSSALAKQMEKQPKLQHIIYGFIVIDFESTAKPSTIKGHPPTKPYSQYVKYFFSTYLKCQKTQSP